MIEFGSSIAAGAMGATGAEILHKDPNSKSAEHYLQKIHELFEDAYKFYKSKPSASVEEHITTIIFLDHVLPIRFKGYLAVYILTAVTSTFNVTVSGVGTFVWTPTVGVYNRWRFPEGSTIQLVTPNASPSLSIDILYTNDISS